MAMQKKHRTILDGAIPALYEHGVKTTLREVPVGSLVIAKFVEKIIFDGEDPVFYQLLVVYHHNKNDAKCGEADSVYSHFRETELNLEHDQECVVLQAAQPPVCSLAYYEVKIESVQYFLKSTARVLAYSEEQAKDLAGAKFHLNVQSFLEGPGRHTGTDLKIVDRILLLKDAVYNVEVLSDQPAVLNSSWDRIQ